MRCTLRSLDGPLPGNYPYEQRQGIPKQFPAQPMPEAQAQAVYQFRLGNHLERASFKEALEDVVEYQCLRLGCNPMYCVPVDQLTNPSSLPLPLNSSSPIITPCKGCGVVLT